MFCFCTSHRVQPESSQCRMLAMFFFSVSKVIILKTTSSDNFIYNTKGMICMHVNKCSEFTAHIMVLFICALFIYKQVGRKHFTPYTITIPWFYTHLQTIITRGPQLRGGNYGKAMTYKIFSLSELN